MADHILLPLPPSVEPRHSLTCLHALLENSPIAIVVLDARHRFTMCNPAFEKLFQYSPRQLASAELDALIAGPEFASEAAELTRLVLNGNKVHTVAQRRRRDGCTVDVEIHGIPLMIDGELVGVYALYQDVTDRNRVQLAFREMSQRFENLQSEERQKLARDLHDSTSQELAILNWNLTRLSDLVCDQGDALRKLVRQTRELAQQCSARIRSASYLLLPPILGAAGLTVAIARMAEGFEQRSGIRVMLEMTHDLGRFSEEVEIAMYRIAQEGLANVLRHSGSTEVRVSLRRKMSWLELTMRDEGRKAGRVKKGDADRGREGIGISGMRGRLAHLGGFLDIECSEQGTTLVAVVPLEA